MMLVVDVNVVFSSLINSGTSLRVFEMNKMLRKFELVVPEYFFFEMGLRVDKILSFTHFSKSEFSKTLSFIKSELEIIPLSSFDDMTGKAESLSPDEKDVAYIALALKFGCKVLSGDKKLKEALPELIATPSEALNILLGRNEP